MLSPTVRAAAAQFATSQLGTTTVKAVELGYLTGYAAGYVAPKAARFPLGGDQAFKRLLGAYLAEGITVYHPHSGRYGRLMGLPACYSHDGQPFADVEFYADAEAREEACGDLNTDVSKILPVLYSFEDLATELLLPDGRRVVPAVEVANIHLAAGGFHARAVRAEVGDTLTMALMPSGGAAWRCADYELSTGHLPYYQAQALLRMGFAVGLTPDEYHRRVVGVDYASGAKPTSCAKACAGCEKGASHV